MNETPENVKEVELFAWVGEDEFGSGVVGLKQAKVPAGMIALVSVDQHKIDDQYIKNGLQRQANNYRKTIRLCKFKFVEEVVTLEPEQ